MERIKCGLLMLLALTAMVTYTSDVNALPVDIGDKIIISDGPGNTGGGEFYVNVLEQGGNIDFITFCLERNEYITFGATYTVANISTAAVNGGFGGGSPDPLDPRTAFLYTQFVRGTLAGYIYNGTTAQRATSADALQNAIWYIENEISTLPTGLATTFYKAAVAANWQDIGSVRVLNLVDRFNNKAQDQLVVPEPATLILLGAGLAGLGAMRRRMRK